MLIKYTIFVTTSGNIILPPLKQDKTYQNKNRLISIIRAFHNKLFNDSLTSCALLPKTHFLLLIFTFYGI